MRSNHNQVCIIGGGASGVFTLCNLIDLKMEADNLSPLHVTLIEKNNQLGDGLAYRNDYASNLLNTAAGLFSEMNPNQQFCLKNQPSFLKWVRENESSWRAYCPTLKVSDINKNTYLPRLLVGIYLRHILAFYMEVAPLYQVHIHIIKGEVSDLQYKNLGMWAVTLSDQQNLLFSHVVLALGGFLKNNFSQFEKEESFLRTPWPTSDELKKILNTGAIGIMGTKLSALDTVSLLKSNGYQGKIILASRSGFLPSVKNTHHAYQPFLLTKETLIHLINPITQKISLNDLLNLVQSEIEFAAKKKINWQRIIHQHQFSISWLRWQIKMANGSDTLWNSLLATASDFFMEAWQWLSDEDKLYFNRKLAPIWDTYRFSMPLCTAVEIMSGLKNKAITLLSRISPVEKNRDGYLLNGFDAMQEKWVTLSVDCLVNATGVNYTIDKMQSPLIQNLLKHGIIFPNGNEGILMDEDGITVRNQSRCYALGDLTRGTFFYTNSYLFCINQAAIIARSIYKDITHAFDGVDLTRYTEKKSLNTISLRM